MIVTIMNNNLYSDDLIIVMLNIFNVILILNERNNHECISLTYL